MIFSAPCPPFEKLPVRYVRFAASWEWDEYPALGHVTQNVTTQTTVIVTDSAAADIP
ncbi:hypothetical protein GCM10009608_47990 [Pseudonocardia alaniniphila]